MGWLGRALRGEQRSSLATYTNELGTLFAGAPASATGAFVSETTALSVTAVYACVRVIAESIASLPIHVYRRDNEGRRRADDHPLSDILRLMGNREMTAYEVRENLVGHVCLWGNAYAEVEWRGDGTVAGLWPLRPDRVIVRRRDNDTLEYEVLLPNGQRALLPAWRVFRVRGFGTDPAVGLSPIAVAREAVALAMAAEQYGARFFGNDSRPGGVLRHPGRLTHEAVKRLKASWEDAHRGLDQAHRVAILEEGVEWQSIGIPPEDAQFLETRRFQVSEIARLFRVPPHLIGDLERATFSNIEHQSIEFVVHTLRPWLVRFEQAINTRLLTAPERRLYYAEHVVDGLLRGDVQARYSAYATARQWGWLSANDIRRLENMEPIEGGDTYLVPLNMVPVSSSQSAGAPTRALEMRALAQTRDWSAARRRAAQRAYPLVLDAMRRIVHRELADVRPQARRILRDEGRGAELITWLEEYYDSYRDYVERTLLEPIGMTIELSAEPAALQIAHNPPERQELNDFIAAVVAAMATRHVVISLNQLRNLARSADALRTIEERLDNWNETRAERVAGMLVTEAREAAAREVYRRGNVQRLRWRTDGEACPYCDALEGRIVGINEYFLRDGEEFQPEGADRPLAPSTAVGHAPAHEGCDCMIEPE